MDWFFGFSVFQVFSFYICVCAAFMYIIIMGPSRFHRDGVVGWLNRVVLATPRFFGTVCLLPCCGCRWSQASRSWIRVEDRVMNKKHPGMLIFYVLLIGTAEYFYLSTTVPRLPTFGRKLLSWFFIALSEFFFVWACVADPGVVTPQHLVEEQKRAWDESKVFVVASERRKLQKKFLLSYDAEKRQNRRYVVDDILYAIAAQQLTPSPPEKNPPPPHGVVCSTCEVPRPSRSKHCKLCGHCVRRFDHHCPWVNNDVGENNHSIFLMFLLTHVVSCFWASVDSYSVLMDTVVSRRLIGAVFMEGNRRVRATWLHLVLYLVNHETTVCCLFLFTALIGGLLFGFWAYQMRMVMMNMTSNDLNKVDDVLDHLHNQLTAADVLKEATQLAETMYRWTGRKVSLPTFPASLSPIPTSKRVASQEAPAEASRMLSTGTATLTEQQKKESRKYRKEVIHVISKALKSTFDAGGWVKNVHEMVFPYYESSYHKLWEKELAPRAARKERLFSDLNAVMSGNVAAAKEEKKGGSRKKR